MGRTDEAFFSDLLKRFRKRKHLTQLQLAKLIGVSRESISLWERGEYKPETLTLLHEIARVLELRSDEQRLLFEAHVGTASVLPFHNLPEHNFYFTGREEILVQLNTFLTVGSSVALLQAQAVSGLGGTGKTQVALEYAYRFREQYHNILWVGADSRETLTTSFAVLARHLLLRERDEQEQHKAVEAVKRWLREHRGWLLILDNIEDLSLVREFVPSPRQGSVILTTRRAETRPIAQPIPLDVMSGEEGCLFLLKRAGMHPPEAFFETIPSRERQAAKAVVHAVGGLPLALDQAGAYIAEIRCSLGDYFALFQQEKQALLQRRGTVPSDHPQSVATTFTLIFEQVLRKNEAAIDLLKLCAFLAPEAIPLELFTEDTIHLQIALESVAANSLSFDQALETLQAYSLIRRERESNTISIHQLVQVVMQENMTEMEQKMWIERSIVVLDMAFPQSDHTTWRVCERLVPHVLTCNAQTRHWENALLELASLLSKTAFYLTDRAHYEQAEPLYLRALDILEQMKGPEHPDVAKLLDDMADLYFKHGKYEQAKPLFERELSIWEQTRGSQCSEVAKPLNGLADIYFQQGSYEQAKPLYERSLHIWEQEEEPKRSDPTIPLQGLANISYLLEEYEQAEPLYKQVLYIREQTLGSEHPVVAHTLNNLANLYFQQAKYKQAKLLYQQCLRIWEQTLGSEHPTVAHAFINLGNISYQQGKFTEAELFYQQALRIWEQAFGSDHTDVANVLVHLASAYGEQEQYEQAEPLYQRALHIWEQAFGSNHTHVAYVLNELANLYFLQKRYEQAEALYQRALHIWEPIFGGNHMHVAHVLNGLANLYTAQKKYTEAEPLFHQALHIGEHHLGQQHPETASFLHDFAAFWDAQSRIPEAISLYQRAYMIRQQTLSQQHPKTRATHQRLTALLHQVNQDTPDTLQEHP